MAGCVPRGSESSRIPTYFSGCGSPDRLIFRIAGSATTVPSTSWRLSVTWAFPPAAAAISARLRVGRWAFRSCNLRPSPIVEFGLLTIDTARHFVAVQSEQLAPGDIHIAPTAGEIALFRIRRLRPLFAGQGKIHQRCPTSSEFKPRISFFIANWPTPTYATVAVAAPPVSWLHSRAGESDPVGTKELDDPRAL